MDRYDLIKHSIKCPLYKFKSGLLSPLGINLYRDLYEQGNISVEAYNKLLGWCDLCKLCSEAYQYVKKCWEDAFSDSVDLSLDVIEEGVKYFLVPEVLYNNVGISIVLKNLINRLNYFGFEVGLSIYTGFPYKFIEASLYGFRDIRRIFKGMLLSEGIDDIIVIDRYTNELVGRPTKLYVQSPSKLINDILTLSNIYPVKSGLLTIHLINSVYKFYRKELLFLNRYIGLIPQIYVKLSSERYGLGFSPLFRDYTDILISYFKTHLPSTTYIVSTVDPLIYSLLREALYKRYAISYLPLLILSILRKY